MAGSMRNVLCAIIRNIRTNSNSLSQHRFIGTTTTNLDKTRRLKSRGHNAQKQTRQEFRSTQNVGYDHAAQDGHSPGHSSSLRANLGHEPSIDAFTIPANVKYQMLRESDKRFGPVVALTKNRKNRDEKNIFLLEGSRHILSALNLGIRADSIFFTSGELLQHFPLDDIVAQGTELYKVKMGHMQLWSTMVAASGIMAVCKKPNPGEPTLPIKNPLPFTLVCENLTNFGDIGSLLRSAAAAGCQQVLFAPGSGDPWHPKAIRAGGGAQYCLNMLTDIKWSLIGNYIPSDSNVFVTDGKTDDDAEANLSHHTHGKIMDYMDSAETKIEEIDEESDKRAIVDSSFTDKQLIDEFESLSLDTTCYSSPDYTDMHTVVIVSGDISGHARKLIFDKHGARLHVPLCAPVPGINTCVSASLVMFEINRQHVEKRKNIHNKSDVISHI